jgi:FAD/FMN-containing dehydrogenase
MAADPEAGLARLHACLRRDKTAAQGARLPLRRWLHRSWQGIPVWTTAALAAQLLLIGGLGYWLHDMQAEAPYRTLAAAPVPHAGDGNVVVVFAVNASSADMRRILLAARARVVDGPLVSGGYLVAIPRDEVPAALARLRRDPAVRLVQALQAVPAP